jgi:hypothetical protein
LKPVTGTFNVPKDRRDTYPPSRAFDEAWRKALDKAAKQWGVAANGTQVDVHYRARIDVWNPGGVGWCSVTLAPGGG